MKDRVIAGDVVALTSDPGVGAKPANRIIVDLKEKFMKTSDASLGFEEGGKSVSQLFSGKQIFHAIIKLKQAKVKIDLKNI